MDMYNLYNETRFKKKLTEEEQDKLLNLAEQGDYDAQQKLFEYNLRLVHSIINTNFPNLEYELKEEMFQVGCIGLWEAIQKYRVTYGNKFSTYAYPTILGEIKNHFRNNNLIWVPMPIQINLSKIRRLQLEYREVGKELSLQEISDLLSIPVEEVSLAINSSQQLTSLNQSVDNENDDIVLENVVADKSSEFESLLEKREFKEKLLKVINSLNEREQIIIKYSFGIGCHKKEQTEISEILNLSTKHIQKIKMQALQNLKKKILENEYIKEEAQIKERIKKERKKTEQKLKIPQMLFKEFPKYSEEQILDAIECLNDDNQTIVELKYGLNGNNSRNDIEIAKKVGIETRNVRERIYVIKKQVKGILDGQQINIKKIESKIKTPEVFYKNFPAFKEEQVLEALNFLSNYSRMIIELKYGLNGNIAISEEEISKIFKVKPESIRTKIYDIKKEVKTILEYGPIKKQRNRKEVNNSAKTQKNGQAINNHKKLKTIFDFYKDYTSEEVLNAISCLNEQNKKIIELRYGLNNHPITKTKSIAQQFNITSGTMSQRITRIKKQIKKILKNPSTNESIPAPKIENNSLQIQYNKNMQQSFFGLYRDYTEEQILGVINTLSIENKRIIELKYGLNGNIVNEAEDISRMINIDTLTVKNKISLIRNQIQRRLEKGYFKRETIFVLYKDFTEKQILGAISTLNKENQRIIELKYGLNGNEYTETNVIAKEFNLTVKNVNSRLWAIKEQIKYRLENEKFQRETIFDLFSEYSKEQVLGVISTLPDEDKLIIELKYGLNGNEYTETNIIAIKLNTTVKNICSKIEINKRKIQTRLENGQFEKDNIFTLFKKYTKEQILEAIDTLSEESKNIIELRYGIHNNEPISGIEIEKKYNVHRASARVYAILKQIEKRLEKINKNTDDVEIINFEEETKEDLEINKNNIKTLINLLDNPIEQIILTLRLGYVNNKYYTTKEISKILNINEEIVMNTINQGFANIINITNTKTEHFEKENHILTKTIK